ncbi:hypothetical protein FOA52_014288 [Chlamydomonas sp. UWO 241]|nr:hypothetical protein FOA52_014288 [Chlamydomonas sp. UWO 241]
MRTVQGAGRKRKAEPEPEPSSDAEEEQPAEAGGSSDDVSGSGSDSDGDLGVGEGEDEDGDDGDDADEDEDMDLPDDEFGAGPLTGGDGDGDVSDYGEEGEEEGILGGSAGSSEDEDDGKEESDDSEGGEEASKKKGPTLGLGPAAKFLEGEKGASFAKAFAKIVEGKAKARAGGVDGVPILQGSKSTIKTKAEEEQVEKADRAAKKLRHEMRKRGHVKVPKRGDDPAADMREKQLTKLATRGVVLLFNAVAKTQKDTSGKGAATGKAGKLSKAAFLTQLKSSSTAVTSSAGAMARGVSSGGVLGLGRAVPAPEGGAPAWRVLADDYSGLPGTSKMKDWDKDDEDSDGGVAQQRVEAAEDDGGDDDGW